MNIEFKQIVWRQFGGAIDMLENAIMACPEELWGTNLEFGEFWYLAYHTLFWLDLYLSDNGESFRPPQPFTLSELDYDGILPERIYARPELTDYLTHCRKKFRRVLDELTEQKGAAMFEFGTIRLSFAELLLYNMRHVQHHTAQLNRMLSLSGHQPPRWVRYNETQL